MVVIHCHSESGMFSSYDLSFCIHRTCIASLSLARQRLLPCARMQKDLAFCYNLPSLHTCAFYGKVDRSLPFTGNGSNTEATATPPLVSIIVVICNSAAACWCGAHDSASSVTCCARA